MLEFTTKPAPGTEETRVPLFSVDGVEYSMPAEIHAGFALQVLERVVNVGEVAAIPWILRKLVGDKGVDALFAAKNFQTTDLDTLGKIVQEHVMGALEEQEKAGKAPSAGESGN